VRGGIRFVTKRSALRAIVLLAICAIGLGGWLAMVAPGTPLPPQWNPTQPLRIADPVTPLTNWKLLRAARDPVQCRAALARAARFAEMPDFVASDTCHIRARGRLSRAGAATLDPIETTCAVALRTAMWERHGLQPAARAMLGSEVSAIHHAGSYSCREIRNPTGSGGRMSTHASAEAIDITGFRLLDGRRISLLADWTGTGPEARFLRAARDASCRWFRTTLSPDYNRLHADHFHLQSQGWGTCR
jgi:hypothetical protein